MRTAFSIDSRRLMAEVGMLADFPELDAPVFLHHPVRTFSASLPDEIPGLLQAVEAEALRGAWVGGFLAFEAAAAFGLPVGPPAAGLPLAWFAVFDQAEAVTYPVVRPATGPVMVTPEVSRERYRGDLEAILDLIRAGDSYQVNHTLSARLAGAQEIDPATLFLGLHTRFRHPYGAWLNTGSRQVASFSPELFLSRSGDRLTTAPIKGTRPRDANAGVDGRLGDELERSEKDRAEHVMIVDMARNDLGRICRIGSIAAPHLCEHRLFSSVHHLETRVHGRLRPGIGLERIMAAAFPAASITGAPKHRTMAIIRDLERRPRGLYTGSLGVVRPGGDFVFNVAIRTVTWEAGGVGRVGLGGGIVADSEVDREWAEVADKGRFLESGSGDGGPPMQLIETLLRDADGRLPGLSDHLARLAASARALGFACDLAAVARTLAVAAPVVDGDRDVLRLRLSLDGAITLDRRPFPDPPAAGLRVRLAARRLDRRDRLLRHKTSRRDFFDDALRAARAAGYDEVLWTNNLGRVTEGSIRAVAVRLDGRWRVPPLADGLLASIWRQGEMVRLSAEERGITLSDLCRAEAVRMGNSVQGGLDVARIDGPEGEPLWTAREEGGG